MPRTQFLRLSLSLAGVCIACAGMAAGTQDWPITGPALIKDINTDLIPINAAAMISSSVGTLFRATTASGSNELWLTDGTSVGTRRLGPMVLAYTDWNVPATVDLGGKVVFYAGPTSPSPGIWVTDGTPAGTTRISTVTYSAGGPVAMIAHSGLACICDLGRVVVTDGTAPGTKAWTVAGANDLTSFAGSLFVLGSAGLGTLDTTTGTFTSVSATGGVKLAVVNGKLLWHNGGGKLVVSDGTKAGTAILNPGTSIDVDARAPLVVAGNRVLIRGLSSTTISDATLAGTTQLASFPLDATPIGQDWYAISGAATGVKAVYRVYGQTRSMTQVASTTDSAIRRSDALKNGLAPDVRFVSSTGRVYFRGYDAGGGTELWSTDGTPEGSARVVDFVPGPADGAITQIGRCDAGVLVTPFANHGADQLVLVTGPNSSEAVGGLVDPGVTQSSGTQVLANHGSSVLLGASSPDGSVFATQGSAASTTVFTNIVPSPGVPLTLAPLPTISSDPVTGDRMLLGRDAVNGSGLWYFRAATGELALAETVRWLGTSLSAVLPLAKTDTAYFYVNQSGLAYSLYRTHGAPGSASLVASFDSGLSRVQQTPFAGLSGVGPSVFFRAQQPDGTFRAALCDQIPAGIIYIGGLLPESSENGQRAAYFKSKVYFSGKRAAATQDLCRANHDGSGLEFVEIPNPDLAGGSNPKSLTLCGGSLYFTAKQSDGKTRLFRLAPDLSVVGPLGGLEASSATLSAGSTALFVAAPPLAGGASRLWISDGSDAGTRSVTAPDGGILTPSALIAATSAGTFWSAKSAGSPDIVWRIDESSGTAVPMNGADPAVLPLTSAAGGGVVNHSRLFFAGQNLPLGTEPFVIDLCPADLDNDGVSDLSDFYAFFEAFNQADAVADRTGDGAIDLLDFFWFFQSFDLGCPG